MMIKPMVGLDIDGVIADFTGAFFEKFALGCPTTVKDYYDPRFKEHFGKIVYDDDFWLSIKPLVRAKDIKFPVTFYLTSRPTITETATRKWLRDNKFPKLPLIYSDDKHKVLKSFGCSFFIEDCFDNYKRINKAGIKCLLVDTPYNEKYDVEKLKSVLCFNELYKNYIQ